MKKLAILVLLTLALTGCKQQEWTSTTTNYVGALPPGVKRFIDDDAGVVCYTYRNTYDSAGISCLPLSETKLGR